MSARAWDDDFVDQALADAAEDPSWDAATELLWDEHLERQAGRRADARVPCPRKEGELRTARPGNASPDGPSLIPCEGPST